MPVPEGIRGVHQYDIDVRFQHQILKSVIQDQHVCPVMFDGVQSGFHPVFIHQNRHPFQVGGKHVRLVPGIHGVQQKFIAVRNDLGRDLQFLLPEHVPEFVPHGVLFTAVSPA